MGGPRPLSVPGVRCPLLPLLVGETAASSSRRFSTAPSPAGLKAGEQLEKHNLGAQPCGTGGPRIRGNFRLESVQRVASPPIDLIPEPNYLSAMPARRDTGGSTIEERIARTSARLERLLDEVNEAVRVSRQPRAPLVEVAQGSQAQVPEARHGAER
jgi:hypothetical protein